MVMENRRDFFEIYFCANVIFIPKLIDERITEKEKKMCESG